MSSYGPGSTYKSPFIEKARKQAQERSKQAIAALKEQRQTLLEVSMASGGGIKGGTFEPFTVSAPATGKTDASSKPDRKRGNIIINAANSSSSSSSSNIDNNSNNSSSANSGRGIPANLTRRTNKDVPAFKPQTRMESRSKHLGSKEDDSTTGASLKSINDYLDAMLNSNSNSGNENSHSGSNNENSNSSNSNSSSSTTSKNSSNGIISNINIIDNSKASSADKSNSVVTGGSGGVLSSSSSESQTDRAYSSSNSSSNSSNNSNYSIDNNNSNNSRISGEYNGRDRKGRSTCTRSTSPFDEAVIRALLPDESPILSPSASAQYNNNNNSNNSTREFGLPPPPSSEVISGISMMNSMAKLIDAMGTILSSGKNDDGSRRLGSSRLGGSSSRRGFSSSSRQRYGSLSPSRGRYHSDNNQSRQQLNESYLPFNNNNNSNINNTSTLNNSTIPPSSNSNNNDNNTTKNANSNNNNNNIDSNDNNNSSTTNIISPSEIKQGGSGSVGHFPNSSIAAINSNNNSTNNNTSNNAATSSNNDNNTSNNINCNSNSSNNNVVRGVRSSRQDRPDSSRSTVRRSSSLPAPPRFSSDDMNASVQSIYSGLGRKMKASRSELIDVALTKLQEIEDAERDALETLSRPFSLPTTTALPPANKAYPKVGGAHTGGIALSSSSYYPSAANVTADVAADKSVIISPKYCETHEFSQAGFLTRDGGLHRGSREGATIIRGDSIETDDLNSSSLSFIANRKKPINEHAIAHAAALGLQEIIPDEQTSRSFKDFRRLNDEYRRTREFSLRQRGMNVRNATEHYFEVVMDAIYDDVARDFDAGLTEISAGVVRNL